jgi:hypothetical protein
VGHGGSGGTDFENSSHAAMISMVEKGKPSQLMGRGQALTTASGTMKTIADDLKKHIDSVQWDSDAGDAFREWGHSVAKSTHTLSEYAKTAGTHMTVAGQSLSEVQKAMPKVPQDALTQLGGPKSGSMLLVNQGEANQALPGGVHPGITNPDTMNAYNKLEGARQEAIKQMNKLSSSYSTSADSISKQEEPTFPDLPPALTLVDDPSENRQRQYPTGSESNGTVTGFTTHDGTTVSQAHVDSGVYQGTVKNDDFVYKPSTEIDSVDAPPNPSTTHDVTPFVTSPTDGPKGPQGPQGPFLPPSTGPGLPTTGPGGGPQGNLPRSPYTSSGPKGSPKMRVPGLAGGDEHIVGGQPGPARGPSGQIPRGNVIGGEEQQQSSSSMMRRPMSGPMGGGGLGGPNAGGGAAPLSRRLASEGGGVVGGARTPTGERQAFTPGGAGLRREGTSGTEEGGHRTGPTGTGMKVGRGGENRGRRSQRPDYLVEDEETWNNGDDGVAPPVIE